MIRIMLRNSRRIKVVFTFLKAAWFGAIPLPLKARYHSRSIQTETFTAAECVDYTTIFCVVSHSTSIYKRVLYWNASCKQCERQYFILNFVNNSQQAWATSL